MVTLSLATIVFLAVLTLGIMWLIGLFNKRINGHVNLIVGFARTLKVNKTNARRLPSRLWLLIKLLPRKRGLILLKMLKRIRINRQERINCRRGRHRDRKEKRRNATNKKPLK